MPVRRWYVAAHCDEFALGCSSRISGLSSGVACARKSSTPDSAAIAAAVSGLSPVIITVRMPICRNSEKRSRMPPLTMSFRWITPSSRPSLATASGVPPSLAMRSAITVVWRTASEIGAARNAVCAPPPALRRSGPLPPPSANAIIESTAPLRIETPSTSMPLIRVCAENGTKLALSGAISRARKPYFSLAKTTIERPSGVSSESEASCAASASSASSTPGSARNSVAWRLPSVIVPVLSSSKVSTSPSLDRAARHREHVEAHQPVHAGDAVADARRRQDQGDEGAMRTTTDTAPCAGRKTDILTVAKTRSASCRPAGC